MLFISATAAIALGATLVLALTTFRGSPALLGQAHAADALLCTQAKADFDGDGDNDFQDLTVFAAFYEEGA